MPSDEKLRRFIAEVIGRPKNVEYSELERVLTTLGASSRQARHGIIFFIPGCSTTLMLNPHNDGQRHLPSYCVKDFAKRMAELGLLDQEQNDKH